MMNSSLRYTALDLLNKVIDFTNMSPDSAEWSFEEQQDNPPRLVRLQQIQALMEAFLLGLRAIKDIGMEYQTIKLCIESIFLKELALTKAVTVH